MTTFSVNGRAHSVEEPGDTPLLWVLRETLGYTGVKFGCGVASCGACTIRFNGSPARACVLPLAAAEGADIQTIEGIQGKEADAVRRAWTELQVPQCGWCQSGQIMSAAMLLQSNPKPDEDTVNRQMAGNICRCATYPRIRAAVRRASEILEA